MSDEPDDHNVLLGTIGMMRAELDAVIGEELDRLRVGRLAARRAAGPTGVIDVEVSGSRPRVLESGREVREAPGWDEPRYLSGDSGPAPPLPEGREEEGSDSGETERRLDALALRLEGRLRRTRDREAHRYRPNDEGEPDSDREVMGER